MMKTRLKFLTLIFFSGGLLSCNAQTPEKTKGEITWISFEKAVELNQTQPRKIFIDVYTSWCGWCKRMDATTFKDSTVMKYMNENYYAVKLDAERKDTVLYSGKTFIYKPEYKAHELAISLLNGQMGYPSFVFLDEKMTLLSPLSGYQTVEQLMPALKYFGSDIYKTKSWEDYSKGN
jgi:thioredoxin-related protein